MDTQWTRFYVFEQAKPGAPLRHAGSVHAPDAEMALLNARDVFARRPDRTMMWVVPDNQIFSWTKSELEEGLPTPAGSPENRAFKYHVFQKKGHKGVFVHVGEVLASSPEIALSEFISETSPPDIPAWWVIPDSAFTKSQANEQEALYKSATDKKFRHESHYPVRTMMRRIKKKKT